VTAAGYDVTLIAQHYRNEVVDGINIIALAKPRNRLCRMMGTWWVFWLALQQKANIYHFHDPELLPIGVLLKLMTKDKVIYDVHENVKEQILTKHWLPYVIRKPISWLYQSIEKIGILFMDSIIIAEDSYTNIYAGQNKITSIKNYPLLSMSKMIVEGKNSRPTIVYVGGINEGRGALDMIYSIRLLKAKYESISLILIGPIDQDSLNNKIHGLLQQALLQDNVSLIGRKINEEIYSILSRCHIGLAVLHPEPNYLESLPTKLFEYMSVGLPVVASNFPLWKEIVEGDGCGLTVNPLDPTEIASAIQYLLDRPDEALQMGANGRKAVLEKYNWETEGKKLLALYEKLLNDDPR